MEPRNIAPPQWVCPICETNHRSNYDAAVACIALGEPVAPNLPAITVWTSQGLAALEVGEIRPSRDAHVRTLTLAGYDHTNDKRFSRNISADDAIELVDDLPDNVVRIPASDHNPRIAWSGERITSADLLKPLFGIEPKIERSYTDRATWWRSPTSDEMLVLNEFGVPDRLDRHRRLDVAEERLD